jgi:hypothetical protein
MVVKLKFLEKGIIRIKKCGIWCYVVITLFQ